MRVKVEYTIKGVAYVEGSTLQEAMKKARQKSEDVLDHREPNEYKEIRINIVNDMDIDYEKEK